MSKAHENHLSKFLIFAFISFRLFWFWFFFSGAYLFLNVRNRNFFKNLRIFLLFWFSIANYI